MLKRAGNLHPSVDEIRLEFSFILWVGFVWQQ
jgi:hypothetical protein